MSAQDPPPASTSLTRWTGIAPLLVGLVLFGLAWLVLDLERQRAADEVRAEVEVTAEQIAARLSLWLDDRLDVLDQFAHFRGSPEGFGDAAFRREARVLLDRVRGFQAINWVDAEGLIQIVEPGAPNAPALGRDLTVHPREGVRRAVERSLDTLLPSRTPWIELYQGGSGFSVYWPVETPGETYGGIVNGVFGLELILTHALPELTVGSRQVVVLAEADGTRVFGTGELDDALEPFRVEQTVDFLDSPLRLLVQPRALPAGQLLGASYLLLLAVSAVLAIALAVLARGYLLRQADLSRQEAYNRLLLDSTSEGLIGIDLRGRCTFCNSAALQLLGHEEATELVGAPGLAWLSDDDTERDGTISVELFSAIRDGRIFEADRARARSRDGRGFDVTLRSHPLREQGRITGALVSFDDVSAELREAERAQRLTAVLLEVPEMVALLDPSGALVFLNPAARAVLGVGDDPCEGLDARTFMDPDSAGDTEQELLPRLAAEDLWRADVILASRDGTRFPAHVVVMRHSDHHGDLYFSVIARDLREERKAEAERLALEEQFREAQRSESLGLLAGSIAHDFNNMLVGVLGNASLALEHLDRASPARHPVQQVQAATEHAAELVDQLLAYSGHGRFEAHTLDPGQLVREMSGLLRTSVPRRITLDVVCEAGHGVHADATQLRQLAMNLVTNAADAIPGEGRITLRVEDAPWSGEANGGHCFPAPSTPGDYVRIRVADDGIGMREDVIAHIFEPFFSTRAGGKGLGLAAVLGIVRGHGGFLHLRSTPGEGTTFDVYLPPSAEPLGELPVPPLNRETAPPEIETLEGRVLLVDDEAGVRSYLEAALEAMGLEVLSCADGAAGLEIFRAEHASLALVLMDQTMPGLSGDAAWREMQLIDDGVPALLMSGYDEVRIEGSVQALGFVGFLQKPFRFQDLRGALAAAIRERQAVS